MQQLVTISLFGTCVIAACVAAPPRRIVLAPPAPGKHLEISYVKISGVWRPAQYFPKPPPTQSNEVWGLAIDCRPAVQIGNAIPDRAMEARPSPPSQATLIFNPRQALATAIDRVTHESAAMKNSCAHPILIQKLRVGFGLIPSGMGYWSAGFDVRVELALLASDGEIIRTQPCVLILTGLEYFSVGEEARQISNTGNDAIYGALAEGINKLFSQAPSDYCDIRVHARVN